MDEQSVRWDDLRVVLAIHTAGSLSGAARHLGLSHATVFRRLEGIERRLGVSLFVRARRGYTPTPAGEDMAATGARVEREVLGAERRVAGRDLKLSGTLRVTTTDTLFAGLLAPLFADFRLMHPDIVLEVAISNQLYNLTRRDADVAVRPASTPPEMLVGRRIGDIAQAVYGARDCHVEGRIGADLTGLDWVGPDAQLGYPALEAWMESQSVASACRYRVDSMLGMLSAVREGAGVAVLPCYLADADSRLVRLSEPLAELSTDLWLLTHPDLRRVARIRAFLDFIAEAIIERQARLRGTQQ
ncbi:DNA-binding transcriptional regulator, LysR family [Onishia taeanensis]|uniref:DNA-binding transcriptional regulator, LysR family n=1 Tax=Onishia taeanensis TaxID=284577 RepID=A0A1G7MRH7_9GAMM|nr:LysR family transcriptional regulator [Halomonas taeanensis]SDF64317.1 DNA-binding transcriptional regulator, LysR family [Halomonas taeanensis]